MSKREYLPENRCARIPVKNAHGPGRQRAPWENKAFLVVYGKPNDYYGVESGWDTFSEAEAHIPEVIHSAGMSGSSAPTLSVIENTDTEMIVRKISGDDRGTPRKDARGSGKLTHQCLIYQCRNCGKVEEKVLVPKVMVALKQIIMRRCSGSLEETGMVSRFHDVHLCSGTPGVDAVYGIMNLIGGREEDRG